MSNTNQVTLGSRLRDINFGFDRFSGLYIWALFIIIFASTLTRYTVTFSTNFFF